MTYDTSQFDEYSWNHDQKIGAAMRRQDIELAVKKFKSAGFSVDWLVDDDPTGITWRVYIKWPGSDILIKVEYYQNYRGCGSEVFIRDESQTTRWYSGGAANFFYYGLQCALGPTNSISAMLHPIY